MNLKNIPSQMKANQHKGSKVQRFKDLFFKTLPCPFEPLNLCVGKMRSAFVLCLSLLFLSPNVQSQTADSWPQFRANHTLTGVSPSTVPDNLKLLWTYDAKESIESSAAIADGTVYVGASTGDLLAVDLWSGKLKWAYKTKDMILESSPAVGGGMVFVGDQAGVFHAVNASTGKGVWTYPTGSEIKSSPVIVGDKVMIGSYDGSLYCFQMRDGKTAWRLKTENYVHGTPAVVAASRILPDATKSSTAFASRTAWKLSKSRRAAIRRRP